LVEAVGAVLQNHVRARAGRRRRVRSKCRQESLLPVPDDLAQVVDARYRGPQEVGRRIVDGGVDAAAVDEAVSGWAVAGLGRITIIIADDLARIVDAQCNGAVGVVGIAIDGEGIGERGVGAAAKPWDVPPLSTYSPTIWPDALMPCARVDPAVPDESSRVV
jgi:hypothetical protein